MNVWKWRYCPRYVEDVVEDRRGREHEARLRVRRPGPEGEVEEQFSARENVSRESRSRPMLDRVPCAMSARDSSSRR